MPDQGPNRRRFVSWLTNALLTVLAAAVGAPALAYFTSPLWKKRAGDAAGPGFSDAGPIDGLPPGAWRLVTIEVVRKDGWETARANRSVYVRRAAESGDTFEVLSPTCPHLGCSAIWNPPPDDHFRCPCHGGVFSAQGAVVGGPPPRGLDSLKWKVDGGRLWVQWQEFKIGIPNRIAVEA
jgi:quinol---cytochrome c reductase iron-sulfur subunit, bacillus type